MRGSISHSNHFSLSENQIYSCSGPIKLDTQHIIARQLQYNGIAASWVHEGEEPHPLLIDVEASIEDYMSEMLARWAAYSARIELSGEIKVVEACFFNNLIDTLLAHNVEPSKYEHTEL